MNTFGNQAGKLTDRLNRRRQIRYKNSLDKNSIDRLDRISLKDSPTTTRSLDRISLDLSASSASFKSPELKSTDNFDTKQNNAFTDSKYLLEQSIKSQSLEPINEREILAESLSTPKQQTLSTEKIVPTMISPKTIEQDSVSGNLPPVIPPRTIKQYHPIESEIDTHSHSYPIEVPSSPRLPPIITPRTSHKPNSFETTTHEPSIVNRIHDLSQTSLDYPSSDPQTATYDQQKHFNFPLSYYTPMARSTSEQIVSMSEDRSRSITARFTKQNFHPLSYIFSKRMIDTGFTSASSLYSEQSQHKTVWD
ncbi:hypothetical protein I4U23_030164 [Adineta vaga]|nr:hypothetical protein I4U23_030164 [Adineta vaga]